MIPDEWEKIYLYGEVLSDSREVYFYFKRVGSEEIVYAHDIPKKYNVDRKIFLKLLSELRKISNARCNDQYVYGQFSLVKRAKEKLRKEVAFEYIPLTEIAWIHLLKTSIALPTGGSIGDVLVTET